MARDRLGAVALAAAYTTLAACRAAGVVVPGRALPAALLGVQELLVAALLLTRRSSGAVSRRWSDRLVAGAALLVPLGLHVPGGALASVSAVLEVAGLLLALLATATLGRHLGVLPAVRGVTTRGVYAVVRHPMYAAYMRGEASRVDNELHRTSPAPQRRVRCWWSGCEPKKPCWGDGSTIRRTASAFPGVSCPDVTEPSSLPVLGDPRRCPHGRAHLRGCATRTGVSPT